MNLGRLGVWSIGIRKVGDPQVLDAAAEIEQLGYGTIWFSGGSGTRGFEIAHALAGATSTITLATGITSIWGTTPDQSTTGFRELEREHPGRFLLGIGVSHASFVDAQAGESGTYRRPLARTADYLAAIDDVPRDRRIVAALGPKMVDLARRESLGSHPYLVTPEMTRTVRGRIGPDAVVACEQGIVVETDAGRARAVAREHLASYLALPNYSNNWLRHGFDERDLDGGGSNRLVDALVAWGDPAAVAARIQEHFDAGASHVCLQPLGTEHPLPMSALRAVAVELPG